MATISFLFTAASVLLVAFLATGSATTNHLLSGQTLKNGEHLEEDDYGLIMQPDCNLVLYKDEPDEAVWSTKSGNHGDACVATLKRDGNFVIVDRNGTVVAMTMTNGTEGNYILLLQRDRNVVIYSKALWNSGTTVAEEEGAATRPDSGAMEVGGRGKLGALILLGACISALLF